MKREPTLPVNQVQCRKASPDRGAKRTDYFVSRFNRPGLQHAAYDTTTGSAFFQFGADRFYEYPLFAVGDFQDLMKAPNRGQLFCVRFYRSGQEPGTVIPAFGLPSSPGLEF